MKIQDESQSWNNFQSANHFRRAIRKFGSTPISEEDVYSLLIEATLAPSSGNLQPYQLHWVRDSTIKEKVALACNGQKAALSATDLVVIVASPELGQQTALAQLAYVDSSSTLGTNSKEYHRKQIGKFQKILGIGGAAIWTPIISLIALLRPSLSLLPVGHIGSRQWAARNSLFAAQTIMLAAAAKGIDSCPMEGFSATKVAKALELPRGSVIPIIIALGYRADDAKIEERWRRPMIDIVFPH